MFQGKSQDPNTGFLDNIRVMAVSGHQEIYGGDEGLRHHLCVSHGEHFDEGASREEMEERHEDEHGPWAGHRGEWGCFEHDPSEEPTEFHDMHASGGIGEIHRGIGVSLPDRLHRVVHDESRPVHERAQALLDHVSGHPDHWGMHWTTENRVAEDFAERSAKHEADEDQRGRYALNDFSWGHEPRYEDTPLGKPGTAVVFHAHEPSLEAIESDGHRLSNGGAYGWSEHGEREVPIRDTQALDLKGISWAPMHSDDEVPGHGEYTHHEFGHEPRTAAARDGHMSVEDLLSLHSNEALTRKRHFGDRYAEHGDDTRVSTVYNRKAADIASNPEAWGQLDEPIRNGTIDPVLLSRSGSGHTVVTEGQHRIVRAHQLGVTHLPVSYDPGSQEHRYTWDDPEPLEERTAAATGAFVPAAERTESVSHILASYVPHDADAWDEVRANYRWESPSMREFVADVARNGVQRPVPIDYTQDPPKVMNGHTRLLSAERAGRETVPVRQHAGFMDPDDPDPQGRQPGHPEHWTSKPEWQADLKEQYGPKDDPSGDYKDSREAALLGHFEAEAAVRMIDLYHHTTPGAAAAIMREKRMTTAGEPEVFFTTDPDPATSQAAGRGGAVVHLRLPDRLARLDDEFPSGEQHYAVDPASLRPEHFVEPQIRAQAASPEEYGLSHRPDETGPPLHDLTEGDMMPRDIYERMHEYNLYSHDTGLLGEAAYQAQRKARLFRGKPEKLVTIWRSAPSQNPESRNAKRGEINNGDWVGLSRHKALAESYEVNDPPDGSLPADHPRRYHIWSARVPAKHVRNPDGDLTEWGYFGPDVKDIPHSSETCSHRARVKPREAAVQHQGSSETPPEGHQIWAVPREDRSPVGEEVYRNMGTREPGDDHGSAWYQGISYHGPYHVIRHPQTRQVWVVDRHGRDASPTGGHYGNPERDGNWGEHQAWEHQHGLESAGPEAHRFGTPDEPRLNLMNERVPEFPHSRVDPEDEERVRRPEPRVHAPEGHSPGDEYHGSYEVVRHPETSRFHVVDNAGRKTSVLPLNGFETQLQAERSRDYTEKRQMSKEIGRGIADKIFGGMDVLDPGGTPESRQSDENMRTGEELMTRYHGGKGQFKFDSDEEGGAPHYEREHHLESGKPSGWYVKHYGGPRADIYHRATGDEAHDTLWMDEDSHGNLPDTYGEQDLENDLKEWHGQPDGMRRHLEDEPWQRGGNERIQRWKRQRLASAHEVVAHFENPEPPPFTVTAAVEYRPKPEHDWHSIVEMDSGDPRRSELGDQWRQEDRDWTSHVRRGLALGHLNQDEAKNLGYRDQGHDRAEELWDHDGKIVVKRGWQPMPQEMYHVTTNMPAVREHGLRSRTELGQQSGLGLGGGEDDTISLTTNRDLAHSMLHSMHEYHDVLHGRKTPRDMWDEARSGTGAERPFHRELAHYYHGDWKEGEPLPRELDAAMRGVEVKGHGLVYSPQEMAEREGPGWRPHHESGEITRKDGGKLYNVWERDASPERLAHQRSDLYKNFSYWRQYAGGRPDPLFISNDVHGFAAKDPKDFGVVHVRPRPGAQGYPLSGQNEWRTTTGDALEVHRAQRLEHGHLKEASVSLAARYAPGLPNPQTGGDEWFHGTKSRPEDFATGFSHSDSHDHEDEEMRGRLSHWNTLLGSHFAADHGVAEHFARSGASTDEDDDDWGGDDYGSRYQTKDPQSVIHARLHLRNPKVYGSEFDMDHAAYEHEYGERKNYISKHFEDGYEHENAHDEDYDPDTPGDGEEWPLAARYRHDDQQPIPREQMQRRTLFSNPDMPEMPERTRWLNSHPDKAGIARRFKEHIQAQGHDGILYGNEFEDSHATGDGKHWNLSAITFRPEQAEITQHHTAGEPCLGREEAEHQRGTMPQPGQEELPGVEEHADSFPNGFLRGRAVVAHFEDKPPQKTAAGPYMQQKLFHMQPDPTLNEPESGRHNPEDPESHIRWRTKHDENYQPHSCEHCGGDLNMPRSHAEEHQEWLGHQDWHTDWQADDLPDALHRGIGVPLPHDVHQVVHDQSRPVAERAHALARHLLSGPGAQGGLGNFWSADPDVSKTYAESSARRYSRHGEQTPVMFHIRTPEMEHIETDPDQLQHWGVYSYHLAGNREVPVRHQAPLHVTGISWAPPGHEVREPSPHETAWHDPGPHRFDQDQAWTHHQFGDGIRANASVTVTEHTAAAEPSGHEVGRALDQASDAEGAAHQDDLKYVPDWEPLHRALPVNEHDGWMFMQRNDHPAGIVSYKHGITRAYLHADRQGSAWRRSGEGWNGPMDAPSVLHSNWNGHYRDLKSFGFSPQTPYNDDFIAERNRHLRDAGYEVVEGRTPGEHTAVMREGPAQLSPAEERGDRWHEYQNQGNDHLHRGIVLALPEHTDGYVHDESVPREDRARTLQQHFAEAGNGLGMHWTPHPRIAQRAIWNAASGDESGIGAYSQGHGDFEDYRDNEPDDGYWGGDEDEDEDGHGGSRLTEVMFHVRRPGERNRLPQRDQEQYGIGWQHSKDEDEFPLKPGSPLGLAGISWKRHDPGHPNEPFEHVDFPKPVRHVSSRTTAVVAHFEVESGRMDENGFHWNEDDDGEVHLAPPYGGQQLYHGTRSMLEPGEMLTPGDAARHPSHPLPDDGSGYVHATPHYSEASYWGEYASADETHQRMTEMGRGREIRQPYGSHHVYQPRVYEVHPTGPVEPDPNGEGQSYRSAHPMRIGREVRPLECYHCRDEGAAETEHAPGHPHYEHLRQMEDEDDEREEGGFYAARAVTTSVTAHFEDDDEDWGGEEDYAPDLEPAGHERDEHDFIHPMVRDRESGERYPDPDREPKCLNCSGAEGAEVHHRPEDGHPVPGVQQRLDKQKAREDRWDRGEYDRTRYCDLGCEISHHEDREHGIGVHHTFGEGEPEHEDARPHEEMPQLNGPFDDPAGRSSGRYEVRNPSAEHRCHYCRNILPQYRRQASLEATAMAIEPPRHFDFYHGEGSEDGSPRTNALEEHLYNHGGRYTHDSTVENAVQHGRNEAYSGDETNEQRRAHYHDILEGIHQHEHDRALTQAHEAVQHGADPGYPAQVRDQLEGAHRQQWQDEWDERDDRHQAEREHRENGSVRMHGNTVDFSEMENHLRQEHGLPDDGMPEYRLPTYEHGPDPYEHALEDAHSQAHGETGEYRHTEPGEYVSMHWGPRSTFDAEHHLVEHHGFDVNDLRHDEPDLEEAHERDHAQNRSYLTHHLYTVMDPENHLPQHGDFYQGPDAEELREGDPEHHFEVRSRDEDGNEHSGVYHAEDEDHAREMHEDAHPYDEEPHHVGRAPVVPPRRQYTMPAQHADWEPQIGFLQPPSEHGTDEGTSATWQHVPYAAPPRTREALEEHIRSGHGSSAAGYGGSPSELHAHMHDTGWPEHQHDYPEGHDPVFGSKKARVLIAHFEDSGGREVRLTPFTDAAPAIEAAPSLPCPAVDSVVDAVAFLGAWEPRDAADAVQGVVALKEVFEALRGGLRHVAGVLEEMPVDPAVAEMIHEMALSARTAAEDCWRTAPGLPPEAAWEEPPAPPNR
jgi:hypothetical protein